MRKIIAVLGDAQIGQDSVKYRMAYECGRAVIDHGYRLQCGGLGGVMQAACEGARSSSKYKEGDIIGILPSFDVNMANPYIDIPIPTGLDMYRNVIVANASAVVAIGGGAGTLCEISNAWALKRMIVAFENCEGWSKKLAGQKLDARMRYENIPEDQIYGVTNAEEMIALINEKIEKYSTYHTGIIMCRN